MSARAPFAVHLSRARSSQPRPLAWRLLVGAARRAPEVPRLVAAFRFRNDEGAFARRLARRKSNLWVFRSNQHSFCGDFVLVDMSSPERSERPVFVIDLKRGAPLRTGGGGAGVQLRNASLAVADVAARTGVVLPDQRFELLVGDKDDVFRFLCAL